MDDILAKLKTYVGWLCAFAGVLCLGAAIGAGCIGCADPVSPADQRALARGAVLTMTNALAAGEELCADEVNKRHDDALKAKCVAAATKAGAALRGAASMVDAWSDVAAGAVACAAGDALDALDTIDKALGVTLPPAFLDGETAARVWSAVTCVRAPDAGGAS